MQKQFFSEIIKILQKLDSDEDVKNFLIDILTPSETDEISQRWGIVKGLLLKKPQRTIKKELGVSIAKVTRGAKQLSHKEGGFEKAFHLLNNTKKIDKDKDLQSVREAIDLLDADILKLLEKRFALMPLVAKEKQEKHKSLTDKKREEDILQEKRKMAQARGIPEKLTDALFSNVMEESKYVQVQEMVNLTLKELQTLVRRNKGGKIPLTLTFHSDIDTPISIFLKTCKEKKYSFLFESIGDDEKFARYSFMGCNPKNIFKFLPDKTVEFEKNGKKKIEKCNNPLQFLKDYIKDLSLFEYEDLPRFLGGLVGFMGYEYISYVEDITLQKLTKDDVPFDGMYGEYDKLIIFDHHKNNITLSFLIDSDSNVKESYHNAIKYFMEMLNSIQTYKEISKINNLSICKFKSNFSKKEFMNVVEKLKKDIIDGEIFQIVPSQKFTTNFKGDSFDIYRKLRETNPSPYLYYISFPELSLLGASPETFVQVDNNKASLVALAGTYPRSDNKKEDKIREEMLPKDEKERSEHMMLVDLARNDLGKIAKPGKVEVEKLCYVKKYSKVMHLASLVSCELRKNLHALDVLQAVFPRGTLTGAPKIRAMNILSKIESQRRGPYGGAVGYIGYGGNLDAAICIRSVVVYNEKATVQAGAGVVMDSDPEKEYEECINKAKAVIESVGTVKL